MADDRIALITGANQGLGRQVATELARDGVQVFLGSRDLGRGEAAAQEIGGPVTAVQLEVTDPVSIAAAARRIREERGRLDLLVNNAAIATTRTDLADSTELRRLSRASVVDLDEVRAVWNVNVFGALAVYQGMLPLLRESASARIVNVTSALGSLTLAADPAVPFHAAFEPVYAGSKAALHAVTLAMMIELEGTDIKVNLVSPGFANTALVNFEGPETVEVAAREIVRVARLDADGPAGTFTTWEGAPLPW